MLFTYELLWRPKYLTDRRKRLKTPDIVSVTPMLVPLNPFSEPASLIFMEQVLESLKRETGLKHGKPNMYCQLESIFIIT